MTYRFTNENKNRELMKRAHIDTYRRYSGKQNHRIDRYHRYKNNNNKKKNVFYQNARTIFRSFAFRSLRLRFGFYTVY